MGGTLVSINHTQAEAGICYRDPVAEIEKKGGVVIEGPADSATGWARAIQRSEYVEWKPLKAGLGGCNGPEKKKNPYEGWNWPEPESGAVEVEGIALPSPDYWGDVAAGDGFACGIANTGEGFCWGGMLGPNESLVPKSYEHLMQYKTVVVGGDLYDPFACWLGMEDGAMTCVDPHHHYQMEGDYEGPFRQITAGGHYACALRLDHYVECWGQDMYGEISPPKSKFSQIDAGFNTPCGVLQKTGAIRCWGVGEDNFSILTDDPGPFLVVSVSKFDGYGVDLCGIRKSGEAKCGGECCNDSCAHADPGRSEFVAISTSMPHWCVLQSNGEPLCRQGPKNKPWGNQEGPLIAISAGATYLIGIRPWGELVGWGDNSTDQLSFPWNPSRHSLQKQIKPSEHL